jgi:hypothetical protein
MNFSHELEKQQNTGYWGFLKNIRIYLKVELSLPKPIFSFILYSSRMNYKS